MAHIIGETLVNLFFIIMGVVCFFSVWSWLDSRELWNDGICADNGRSWSVIHHHDGFIELAAGDVRRRVSGVLVYGPIADALRRSA